MSVRQWVAVIDDDASLRRSIVRLLWSLDVEARGFSSAEEFLSHADGAAQPACVVADLYLGTGLNGYELKEQLESSGRSLPIVFMTAHAELPTRMQQDRAAVANCMRKPFSKDELVARLTPMLDAFRMNDARSDLESG